MDVERQPQRKVVHDVQQSRSPVDRATRRAPGERQLRGILYIAQDRIELGEQRGIVARRRGVSTGASQQAGQAHQAAAREQVAAGQIEQSFGCIFHDGPLPRACLTQHAR